MSRVATMYSEGTRYNCLVSYEYNGEDYVYTFPYRAADSAALPEVGKKIKYSLRDAEPEVLIEYRKFSLFTTVVCAITGTIFVVICGLISVRDLINYQKRRCKI